MLQTFFNLDIISQAWKIILAGLGNTVLLSMVVLGRWLETRLRWKR